MIGSMGVATMVQSYTTIQNLEQKMNADAAKKVGTDRTAIALVWSDGPGQGRLELTDGTIGRMRIVAGQGEIRDAEFSISGRLPRLEVDLSGVKLGLGACPTLATVRTERNAFTFLPRDVRRANPIFLPQYGVAITTADDPRGYDQIADEIRSSGRVSDSMRFNAEPEETFEAACGRNRKQVAPTWLGLSRDMRTFEVGHCEEYGFWGMIQPRYHGSQVTWPELNNGVVILKFVVGPGVNCRTRLTRRLDDGCLPVLRSQQVEDDVTYDLTAFATLEREPLTVQNVRGTQWQAAYAQTGGNMLSQDDYRALAETTEAETRRREQETICCVRVKACNTGDVPRYAWFRTVRPVAGHQLFLPVPLERDEFDSRAGCSLIDDDRIYAVTLFNNRPMPQSEMAVLLGPGEIATWDMLIPHCPITRRRAEKLAAFDYDRHLASCRPTGATSLTAAAASACRKRGSTSGFGRAWCTARSTRWAWRPKGLFCRRSASTRPSAARVRRSFSFSIRWDGTRWPSAAWTFFCSVSGTTASSRTSAATSLRPARCSGPWASTTGTRATRNGSGGSGPTSSRRATIS